MLYLPLDIFRNNNIMSERLVHFFTVMILLLLLLVSAAYAQGPSAFSDPGAQSPGAAGSAIGGLAPVQPTVDGGAIPTGGTAQVVVRFRNDGSQPVQTSSIRLYPSSNVSATISLDQCQDEALAPGAECAIALSVKGLQSGAWRVEMLVSHTGRTRLVSATLTGNVETSGEATDKLSSDIEAIPDEIDFESLNASQTLIKPVILRNITSESIKISDIYIDASDSAGFSMNADCTELTPGQACIATVRWSPKLRGRVSGVMVVKHDGPTALSSVSLEGDYTPDTVEKADAFPEAVPGRGLLVSSQTEIDFGSSVDKTSTITVSLVNTGDAPLTIRDVVVAGTDNGLSLKGDGCQIGQVLEPIEACPLSVSWSPTYVGTLLDDVQIVHTGARGVLVLPVRGDASGVVSKDQGAVMLSGGVSPRMMSGASTGGEGGAQSVESQQQAAASENRARVGTGADGFMPSVSNPASVLDGLKITSFSPSRAIVAGPGGSRIVFDNEDVVLGGVPWSVKIQRNGIEFTNQGQTVLLLFDRSLSSVNRTSAGSGTSSSSSISSSSTSSTSSSSSSSSGGTNTSQ